MASLFFLVPWLASYAIHAQAQEQIAYKTDVALYHANGKVLWQSNNCPSAKWGPGPDQFGWIGHSYPLCPSSPGNCDGINNYIGGSRVWNAKGGNNLFNYLETQQYAIPASFADKVKSVKFTVKTPGSGSYRVFHKDMWLNDNGADFPSSSWDEDKPAPSLDYPLHGKAGDPLHFSILSAPSTNSNSSNASSNAYVKGDQVLAVWISFRSEYKCRKGHHCCHLKDASNDLWKTGFIDNANNCKIQKPYYQCFQSNGAPWSSGKSAGYINFFGSLTDMADGKPISIHLDDQVQSSIPFTNSYVQHQVYSSNSCNSVCEQLHSGITSRWNSATKNCHLKQSKVVAKQGLGPISITGFGRLSGFKLLDSGELYFGHEVWKNFDGTNGGNSFSGGVFNDHYKLQEWNIMSGLAELTSSDSSTDFAISMRDITVAWAPKRGDGAVLVNAPYRPLDGGSSNNRPASLWDVKTPGGWMDAADGPNLLGDKSVIQHAYLHHADDSIKVSASGVRYSDITVLQGNVGSVIELGNYGDGLRSNVLQDGVVDGVNLHRIVHANGGYDGDGGVLGSRTCPNGISIQQISVNHVTIPMVEDANTVGQLFAIGSVKGTAPFCSGNHGANTFKDLHFLNWRSYVNPSMYSKFFNDNQGWVKTTIDGIYFYDNSQKTKAAILDSAVQIYDKSPHFYCVCATSSGANECWDADGPGRGATNMVYDYVASSNIWMPYGPAKENEILLL